MMKKFKEYGVYALLGMTLTLGVTSCGSDDPKYDDVEPPVVVVKNSISGLVTAMSGEAIQGATVTMDSQSVTTGSDGTFTFEDVAVGTHTLTAAAEGKVSKTGEVTIAATDNMNHIWNVSLSSEETVIKMTVSAETGSEDNTATETLEDNTVAKVEVQVEAPAGAVEDTEAEIIVTPTYSADEAVTTRGIAPAFATRADDNGVYFMGTNVTCSKTGVQLKKPLTMKFNVDKDMQDYLTAMKYKDGKWQTINFERDQENSTVTISVDEFASYAFYCSATVRSAASSSESITFTQNTWDNRYGSSAVTVDKATYTYKVGTDIQGQSNKVLGYLVEILARVTGAGLKTATGTHTLNVTLPIGTAMSISGTQAVTTYTATVKDKSVSAKQYGSVSMTTKTWNRQHTGGSN